MSGIITAGGLATRFYPVTRGTNKHLLQVYDQAMIQKPIQYLANAGIKDIIIVSSPHQLQYFGNVLESAEARERIGETRIHYARQENPTAGIADAIKCAREHCTTRDRTGNVQFVDDICVVLGDNIFEDENFLKKPMEEFRGGAVAFVKRKKTDENLFEKTSSGGYKAKFGMIQRGEDGQLEDLVEKPQAYVVNDEPMLLHPFQTKEVVVGAYILGSEHHENVFDRINLLQKSERGQYEITDLLKGYLAQHRLKTVAVEGYWYDCGTPENMLIAATMEMAKQMAKYCGKDGREVITEFLERVKRHMDE